MDLAGAGGAMIAAALAGPGRIYQHLPVPCDLSRITLAEAALRVGAAFVYELTVHPQQLQYGKDLLKRLHAETLNNPMAPYVNLRADTLLGRDEWVLEANGKACGSPGVM